MLQGLFFKVAGSYINTVLEFVICGRLDKPLSAKGASLSLSLSLSLIGPAVREDLLYVWG